MAISTYTDQIAKKEEIVTGVAKLCVAFPRMEPEFWRLLTERVIANRFTKERIKAAIEHVADNFQYKELNISDIVKFDRRAKLYTYLEVCEMWTKHRATVDDFDKRRINGTVYWVKKTDLL